MAVGPLFKCLQAIIVELTASIPTKTSEGQGSEVSTCTQPHHMISM